MRIQRYLVTAAAAFALALFVLAAPAALVQAVPQEAQEVNNHPVFLPVVAKFPMVTGVVRFNNAPVANQQVILYYSTNSGSSYTQYAQTTTNSSGLFAMPTPPMGSASERYYVYWENLADNTNWLFAFYGTIATDQTTHHDYAIEIADIRMVSPQPGASVSSPTTYVWTRRPFITDNYRIVLTDPGFNNFASISNLGYVDRATASGLPAWVVLGGEYYWWMEADTPSGIAESYYYFPIYFTSRQGPALNGAPLAGWVTGEEMGMSPNRSMRRHPAQQP